VAYSLSALLAVGMPLVEAGHLFVDRVLVTGASGFLGGHIPQFISEAEASVHALGRAP
jgi:hypothetical protein